MITLRSHTSAMVRAAPDCVNCTPPERIDTVSIIKIGVIGVGGFAATHIRSILKCEGKGLCELSAVVARQPYNVAYGEEARERELRRKGVRVYRTYEQLLEAEKGALQLVTVPLGIGLHATVSIAGLRAGYNVLCEKPAAGNSHDAQRMLAAQRETGRFVAIGYQYLLSGPIQYLKSLAISRRFGRLLRARTLVRWPRDSVYYGRNEWAGKLYVDGKPIYDSPMQNAAAHFLQNMLYVAGESADASAAPVEVYAENYHANKIESADTQFARIVTAGGTTIVFVGSHALRSEAEPYSEYVFERATLAWDPGSGARFITREKAPEHGPAATEESDSAGPDRLEIDDDKPSGPDAGSPDFETHDLPFVDVIGALRESRLPRCTIANALQHVSCVEASFESSGGVHEIPMDQKEIVGRRVGETEPEAARAGGDDGVFERTLTVVSGMEEILARSFDTFQGPAELGVGWGRAGKTVRLQSL